MYINCKNCGQRLFIPDGSDNIKVTCPACKNEFIYSSESKSSKNNAEDSKKDAVDSKKDVDDSKNDVIDSRKDYEDSGKAKSNNKTKNKETTLITDWSYDDDDLDSDDPLPEIATRQSYHEGRELFTQPFSSLDSMFTTYRLCSNHFGVMFLFALLTLIPYGIATISQNLLLPELTELQNTLSQEITFQDAFDAYQKTIQSISSSKVMMAFGINLLSFLINIILIVGGIRIFNAFGRNQKANRSLMLSGFDSCGRILLAFILFIIFLFSIIISGTVLIFLPFSIIGLAKFGMIVTMCVISLILVYLFFVLPLIADTNLSAQKSFRFSFLIARENLSAMIGSIVLLFLMWMAIIWFVNAILGDFLSSDIIALIIHALFEPLLVGMLSVVYLKSTGQFDE